jgi:hypothetical protein
MRTRLAACAALSAAAATGCYGERFAPRTPLRLGDDVVHTSVTMVEVGPGDLSGRVANVRATFEVDTSRPVHLQAVELVRPGQGALGTGDDMLVDGLPSSGELAPGRHSVRTVFHSTGDGLDGDVLAEVRVTDGATERVVRVPFAGGLASYRRLPSWTFGTRFALESFDVHGQATLASLAPGIGYATGLVRAQLAVGVLSGTGCEVSVCGSSGTNENGQARMRYGWAWPAALSVKAYPLHTLGGFVVTSFGVGARYSIVYSHVPALSGEYSVVTQGLHGMLLMAFQSLNPRPFRDRVAGGSLSEIEIPLGVWMSEKNGLRETVFGGGIAINFDFAL